MSKGGLRKCGLRRVWLLPLLGASAAMIGCVGYGYPMAGYGDGNPSPGGGDYSSSSGSGYGNTVRCESNDNRTRYCNADTRAGVRLSRRLSDAQCIQGSSWGFDRRGIWVAHGCRGEFIVGAGGGYRPGYGNPGQGNPGYGSPQTVRCESTGNRYQHCNMDTRGGVAYRKRLSDAECIQGRTWGYDKRGVWVSDGCRAEFSTGSGNSAPGYGNGQTVRCESRDGRMRRCDVRIQRGVQLIRQLSNTRCVERQNWGWDRNGIWVNNGCRAEFRVY